ncbi:motility associated factor glycosyltransferase family protein [Paenibacillus humicola]|uniref:motility associated factor glycosyltransferase family protein n=1 Tax=Paenibacillus humicola TaxID=3110540 RepID=UPI00237BC635|nr:6-hydroxymethylpterin diphosphokinase MptE-like protein [Paenibacillus humicola]
MTYLHTNAPYLSEYNEWLMERLKTIDSSSVEAVRAGGDVLFKLADEEGNEFYTASVYDPKYEAEQFLDGVNFDNTGFILIGMGSSAIVKSILEHKTETAWVLIIEKDTALVKKFLEEVDLSPYLEGKLQRIIILTDFVGELSEVLNTYITSMIGYYFLRTDILRTFASYRRDAAFYDLMTDTIINHLRTHMTAMGNSLDDTLKGMTNELRNLPVALNSHKLSDLRNAYKGKPIICVASGPSLDKQLPLLKRAKGKALIICAESAFRVLLKNGISPDIVCILERGENSYELSIKGADIPADTALMGLTLMDPRIPRGWNPYVIPVFKENIVHSRLMNHSLGDRGTLYNGISVAHLNYSLAQYLGGCPIVFIGQDLAYSDDGETHSKHSFYADDSDMDISEEQRKQIHNSLKEDTAFFNKTVYLDGYYGGKVKSRELWRQFLYWMEHLIHYLPAPLVINATEGGADIRGTIKMPFQEVVERYCKDKTTSIPELFAGLPPIDSAAETESHVRSMLDFFGRQLGDMSRVSEHAEEVLGAIRQLQDELAEHPDGGIDFLAIKAGRVLRNVELLLKDVLKQPFLIFFFRPLISNYHVKMNPISRVSSIDRLQAILTHQSYLLRRIVEGTRQVADVYTEGTREAIRDLGLDCQQFELDIQDTWALPDLDIGEELDDAAGNHC